jgi:hypothetical protein
MPSTACSLAGLVIEENPTDTQSRNGILVGIFKVPFHGPEMVHTSVHEELIVSHLLETAAGGMQENGLRTPKGREPCRCSAEWQISRRAAQGITEQAQCICSLHSASSSTQIR